MPIHVRLSDQIIDRIDELLESYEFRGRSHFIATAIRRYVEELEEELSEESQNPDAEADDGGSGKDEYDDDDEEA